MLIRNIFILFFALSFLKSEKVLFIFEIDGNSIEYKSGKNAKEKVEFYFIDRPDEMEELQLNSKKSKKIKTKNIGTQRFNVYNIDKDEIFFLNNDFIEIKFKYCKDVGTSTESCYEGKQTLLKRFWDNKKITPKKTDVRDYFDSNGNKIIDNKYILITLKKPISKLLGTVVNEDFSKSEIDKFGPYEVENFKIDFTSEVKKIDPEKNVISNSFDIEFKKALDPKLSYEIVFYAEDFEPYILTLNEDEFLDGIVEDEIELKRRNPFYPYIYKNAIFEEDESLEYNDLCLSYDCVDLESTPIIDESINHYYVPLVSRCIEECMEYEELKIETSGEVNCYEKTDEDVIESLFDEDYIEQAKNNFIQTLVKKEEACLWNDDLLKYFNKKFYGDRYCNYDAKDTTTNEIKGLLEKDYFILTSIADDLYKIIRYKYDDDDKIKNLWNKQQQKDELNDLESLILLYDYIDHLFGTTMKKNLNDAYRNSRYPRTKVHKYNYISKSAIHHLQKVDFYYWYLQSLYTIRNLELSEGKSVDTKHVLFLKARYDNFCQDIDRSQDLQDIYGNYTLDEFIKEIIDKLQDSIDEYKQKVTHAEVKESFEYDFIYIANIEKKIRVLDSIISDW